MQTCTVNQGVSHVVKVSETCADSIVVYVQLNGTIQSYVHRMRSWEEDNGTSLPEKMKLTHTGIIPLHNRLQSSTYKNASPLQSNTPPSSK